MKRLTAVLIAAFAMAPASASGAETSVACSFAAPVEFSPEISPNGGGSFRTPRWGDADCVGRIRGYTVGTSGLLKLRGNYTADAPATGCALSTGSGVLELSVPMLISAFDRQWFWLDGSYRFQRRAGVWSGSGSAEAYGSRFGLELAAIELQQTGDCPRTSAIRAELHGHLGVGGSAEGADEPPAAPVPPAAAAGPCANHRTGTSGPDAIEGTAGGDFISGLAGADRISGRGSGDCLFGDRGSDRVAGGIGADSLSGGAGRDRVSGGGGDDVVNAADGSRDRVSCGAGRDHVQADRRDRLSGCENVDRGRRSQ